MKKICFVTGTRADYGILAPVMKKIAESPQAELQIIATNMHMSEQYGMTVHEIERDGFKVDIKIDSLIEGGSEKSTAESMSRVINGLTDAFNELNPDLIVILGDRYEALAAASTAVIYNIPIAHLHGGEITEGAIDDKFRNAITQLSDLHFASTLEYAQRIISMGKTSDSVFHSGAPGAEIKDEYSNESSIAEEFYCKTGIYPGEPFILFAMHPVTTLRDKGLGEVKETLEAIDFFIKEGYKVLMTMPNSDPGTKEITDTLTNWASNSAKIVTLKSLGSVLFHYAMEIASVMVGNSSAALIEAPSYRLPAVNVGIRQKGRAHGITVIDSPGVKERIKSAIELALSMEMKVVIMGQPVNALNPYYKEDASIFIADKLINFVSKNN